MSVLLFSLLSLLGFSFGMIGERFLWDYYWPRELLQTFIGICIGIILTFWFSREINIPEPEYNYEAVQVFGKKYICREV